MRAVATVEVPPPRGMLCAGARFEVPQAAAAVHARDRQLHEWQLEQGRRVGIQAVVARQAAGEKNAVAVLAAADDDDDDDDGDDDADDDAMAATQAAKTTDGKSTLLHYLAGLLEAGEVVE